MVCGSTYYIHYGESMQTKKNMKKTLLWYYGLLVFILCIVFVSSGCTPTIELAAHGIKTTYNKCHALDNWQCLWYDNNN